MSEPTAEQAAMCERFGVPPHVPGSREKLGIALATLTQRPLNAMRVAPADGTCGWYVWAGPELSQNADFFAPLHVEHSSEYIPALLPYLAMPPGWRVQLAPNHEDAWFDADLLRNEG